MKPTCVVKSIDKGEDHGSRSYVDVISLNLKAKLPLRQGYASSVAD